MELEQGKEVFIRGQKKTEMFIVSKVKKNGYVYLHEYALYKNGGVKDQNEQRK